MAFDDRIHNWEMATKAGRKARLEDEPLSSNPYFPYGSSRNAALFVCWQRGWTQADREMAARAEEASWGEAKEPPRKLIAL